MPSIELQTGRAYGRSVEAMRRHHGDAFKMYDLAMPYVEGKAVLDIACGTGTGTAFLAEKAKDVVGVDIDADAITHCTRSHKRANLRFVQADATQQLPFPDESFDVIVTFETIEHLYAQEREKYLAQLWRVLKPDGTMLLSTPQNGLEKPLREITVVKHRYDHKLEFHLTKLREELTAAGFTITQLGGIRYGTLTPGTAAAQERKTKKSIGVAIAGWARPITKIVPPVVKERVASPLLGYPYHIDKFSYVQEDLHMTSTFFVIMGKGVRRTP